MQNKTILCMQVADSVDCLFQREFLNHKSTVVIIEINDKGNRLE